MKQFLIEKVSPFDVPTTVEKLIAEATRREWGNPANHNLQNSLAKSGKTVRPIQVVEICKPEYSGRMLELSDERIFSILMPCRISVYEKADGKTYIALMDTSGMATGMPEAVVEAMTAATSESFEIVASVVG
jgi:uncharacterized protein (DUF302 family)